jgi:hypothetical protein
MVLPEKSSSKLQPKGKMGTLIRYTDELQSYQILTDGGKIVEPKNVWFVDYTPPASKTLDWDISVDKPPIVNKEEEPEPVEEPVTEIENPPEKEHDSSPDESNEEVAAKIIPTPEPGCSLRDCTIAVKPVT